MQHLDLSGWSGRRDKRITELLERIHRLVARPTRQKRSYVTLVEDRHQVSQSRHAARRLVALSDQIQTLGGILIPGRGPTGDLLGSLEQVQRTFDAVSGALIRFLQPVVRGGPISPRPYLAMERGSLVTLIERRRGHCARIVEYYGRVGGLRDWLIADGFSGGRLRKVDRAFAELGRTDGELFADLARIGDVLTEEASAIVGLLLGRQQRAARARILEGRRRLLPLEKDLRTASSRMQRIQSSLGHASALPRRVGA
jgi:hypothetical protein